MYKIKAIKACKKKTPAIDIGAVLINKIKLYLFWRQIKCNRFVLKMTVMRTIAKWFIF